MVLDMYYIEMKKIIKGLRRWIVINEKVLEITSFNCRKRDEKDSFFIVFLKIGLCSKFFFLFQ